MPTEKKQQKDLSASTEISIDELQSLNPEVLKELKDKHGLEINIRSNSAAIDNILGNLGRAGMEATSVFTRGFDRTSDMYWKNFDRDYLMGRPGELVSNPAIDLERTSLKDALERLSVDEIAKLKGRNK